MSSSSPNTPCGSPSPAGRPPPRPSHILSRQHKSPQIPSQPPPNTTTKKTPATMPPTKGLTRLSGQHEKSSPQIPSQPRPAAATTTTKNTPATTPRPTTKSTTVQFRVYQRPSNFQGWAGGLHLEAPLRHLGLLDVARLQLPTGVPRPHLVSQLINSYDPNTRCGYVWGSRIKVDRESFLSAVSLHPTAVRRDLPPDVPWSTVTRAAVQFINMCLRVQWRDTLPAVSAAMREVKAGSAHTVDWGKLMWDLVENEILELPKRDDKIAYFGVYLQSLIWVQHPEAFKFDEKIETSVKAAVEKAMNNLPAMLQQLLNKRSNPVERDEAAAPVVQVQQQTVEAQRPHLGSITPNNDAGVYKSGNGNESISLVNDGNMHIDGYNDHMGSQQRFLQVNQQKRPRIDKSCGVPAGSALAMANGSHDIVEIERGLKHATSEELREAETFIQVVQLLQEKLSPETIMHMFE